MNQISLAQSGFELAHKRTRKRVFLDEMDQVIPWSDLLALIAPHAPAGKTGRPPFALQTMLRIHLLQQFFGHSDPAMEEALHDIPLYREFAHLDAGLTRLPDESTILRFRHLLEQHQLAPQILASVNARLMARGLLLKSGTVVDATLIAAPSSTKNKDGQRDPEMHQTKKGNQWHFGMKAHIGVDAGSGITHTLMTTPANAADVTQAHALLHGEEQLAFGDAGYQGVEKREENRNTAVTWHVALRPGKRRALPDTELGRLDEAIEQAKASVRAKVEHPFHIIKNIFQLKKVRYRGLAKNTAQLFTLFGLANLLIAKRYLFALNARGAS